MTERSQHRQPCCSPSPTKLPEDAAQAWPASSPLAGRVAAIGGEEARGGKHRACVRGECTGVHRAVVRRAPSYAKKAASCSAGLQPVDCIVTDEVLSVGVPYFDASKHINHTFTLSSSMRRIVI